MIFNFLQDKDMDEEWFELLLYGVCLYRVKDVSKYGNQHWYQSDVNFWVHHMYCDELMIIYLPVNAEK